MTNISPQKILAAALQQLTPFAQWYTTGDGYANIVWMDTVQTIPTEDAFNAEYANQQAKLASNYLVAPQDLLAQLTAADIAAIQTAISSNPQAALLWFSLLAQRDPMDTTNDRFKAGWTTLVSVLGADRMSAIATALGITITA
ncbi:hypothetical protein HAP48_0042340 [Bradyrhizobium septentrionale]|uniref:Uncharacterized protein n=1 Tax=Bradyrhizobium septentrionale TaxID=1404411 RepID=A0A974A2P9_9BRAD|nr:hypothetical protein [Bradyrhizobium septentrionale]UGY15098.1 hypothetical protein HAP48_0042340 [Bradyrhizobium septentrionale]